MKEIKIARDGQATLVFTGTEIVSTSDYSHNGDKQNRYGTLTLYKTESNQFVLHSEYTTHWQGESNKSTCQVFATLEEVRDDLTACDYVHSYVKLLLEEAGVPYEERI